MYAAQFLTYVILFDKFIRLFICDFRFFNKIIMIADSAIDDLLAMKAWRYYFQLMTETEVHDVCGRVNEQRNDAHTRRSGRNHSHRLFSTPLPSSFIINCHKFYE